MKLGLYRYNASKVRKKRKLTAIDFDIVLFASERDSICKYDVRKYVTNSNGVVTTSLTYLVQQGFLKVTQNHRSKAGLKRRYACGIKGRYMVSEFKTLMSSPVN